MISWSEWESHAPIRVWLGGISVYNGRLFIFVLSTAGHWNDFDNENKICFCY